MSDTRTLTGTLRDGTPVLVHVWPDGDAWAGEVAFKEMGHRTWGVPTALAEDAS